MISVQKPYELVTMSISGMDLAIYQHSATAGSKLFPLLQPAGPSRSLVRLERAKERCSFIMSSPDPPRILGYAASAPATDQPYTELQQFPTVERVAMNVRMNPLARPFSPTLLNDIIRRSSEDSAQWTNSSTVFEADSNTETPGLLLCSTSPACPVSTASRPYADDISASYYKARTAREQIDNAPDIQHPSVVAPPSPYQLQSTMPEVQTLVQTYLEPRHGHTGCFYIHNSTDRQRLNATSLSAEAATQQNGVYTSWNVPIDNPMPISDWQTFHQALSTPSSYRQTQDHFMQYGPSFYHQHDPFNSHMSPQWFKTRLEIPLLANGNSSSHHAFPRPYNNTPLAKTYLHHFTHLYGTSPAHLPSLHALALTLAYNPFLLHNLDTIRKAQGFIKARYVNIFDLVDAGLEGRVVEQGRIWRSASALREYSEREKKICPSEVGRGEGGFVGVGGERFVGGNELWRWMLRKWY